MTAAAAYPPVGDDDGTCGAQHPENAAVRCGRDAGHGPGDMHDGTDGRIGYLWPNEALDQPKPAQLCPKCGGPLPDPLLIAAYRLAGHPPGLWEIHMCPSRPLVLATGF